MLVGDLASTMATEFGEEYTDTDIAAQFVTWVIEVLEEIYTSGRWPSTNSGEDITLVDGTATYSLATTVSEIRQLWDPVAVDRVKYATVERLVARGKDLTAQGDRPTHWYVAGFGSSQELQVGFYPIPNAAAVTAGVIKAHTIERAPVMTTASTIELPSDFIRVAKDGVRARVKSNDGDLQGAQLSAQAFGGGMALLNARFHGKAKAPSRMKAVTGPKSKGDSPLTPEGN